MMLTYVGYFAAYHYLSKFVPGYVVLKGIQGMDPISLDFVKNLTAAQQMNLFAGCLIFVTLLSLYYVGFTVQWVRYVLQNERPKFSLFSFRNKAAKQYTAFLLYALFFFTVGMITIQSPLWAVILTGHQDWLSTRIGVVGGLIYVCVLGGYLSWFITKLLLISIPACGDTYQGLVKEFKKLDNIFWAPFLAFVALLVVYTIIKMTLSPFMWVDIIISPIIGLLAFTISIIVAGLIYKSAPKKA